MISFLKIKITKKSLYFILNFFFTKIFSFFLIILISKKLMPYEYGKYVYFFSFQGIVLLLTLLGFSTLIVKEVSKYRNTPEKYQRLYFIIKFALVASSILPILYFILFSFFNKIFLDISKYSYIYINLILIVTSLANVLSSINYGLERYKNNQLSEIFFKNFLLFFTIWFLDSKNLQSILMIYLIISILYLSILFYGLLDFLKLLFKKNNKLQERSTLIKSIFSLGASSILATLFLRTDIFIIERFSTLDNLANYSIIYQLGFLPFLLASAIDPLLSVRFSQFNNKNDYKIRKILIFARLIYLLFTILYFFFSIIFMEKICALLFPNYSINIKYVNIIIFFCLIISPFQFAGNFLSMNGFEKWINLSYIIAIFSNLILCTILILFYGILGIIIGVLISFFLIYYVQNFKLNKIISIKLTDYLKF
jgi:O-antigen/teichoic acid export membrane protein